MKMVIPILLFLLFNMACQQSLHKPKQRKFTPPIVCNSDASGKESFFYNEDRMLPVFPKIVGQFEFQEEIDISNIRGINILCERWVRCSYSNKIEEQVSSAGLDIIVDYESTVPFGRWSFDSLHFSYYPVYFVNNTQNDKLFYAKDSYTFGLQEATAVNGYRWAPIEHKGFDFCGNGHWQSIIKPGEFMMILMRKYTGEYLTNIRSRFKIGENIYVSLPYTGRINKGQFDLMENSTACRLTEKHGSDGNYLLFYGAFPLHWQ